MLFPPCSPCKSFYLNTVKPEYNGQPRETKIVAVVDRWSLLRGTFMLQTRKTGSRNNGRRRQVVATLRWLLAHRFDCTSNYYLLQLTTWEELETVFGLIFLMVKSLFLFRGGLLFQD